MKALPHPDSNTVDCVVGRVNAAEDVLKPPQQSICSRRVVWSFCVDAQEVFVLCRALLLCEGVEVRRCMPIVRLGISRVRVDITVRVEQTSTVLHQIIRHVNSVEIGRTQLLGLS